MKPTNKYISKLYILHICRGDINKLNTLLSDNKKTLEQLDNIAIKFKPNKSGLYFAIKNNKQDIIDLFAKNKIELTYKNTSILFNKNFGDIKILINLIEYARKNNNYLKLSDNDILRSKIGCILKKRIDDYRKICEYFPNSDKDSEHINSAVNSAKFEVKLLYRNEKVKKLINI